MLAVGGEDVHPVLLRQRQHKRAPRDERLLVGQADVLAALNGRHGGLQAGAAHDAGHARLGLGVCRHRADALLAGQNLRLPRSVLDQLLELCDLGTVAHGHQRRLELADLA